MIVENYKRPVADWWFEDRKCPASRNSRSDLRQLLEMCQSVTQILESHGLLQPLTVIFSDWLGFNPETNTVTGVNEPAVTASLADGTTRRDLLVCCEQTLDCLEHNRPFLYPSDVKILGVGLVIDASGQEIKLPNVTWVRGITLDHHVVDVVTQSDAWLPFNLVLEPQHEVYKFNSPRLELALEEIQCRLEIVPVTDEYSDYAVINGFHLNNHTDVEGNIVQRPISY